MQQIPTLDEVAQRTRQRDAAMDAEIHAARVERRDVDAGYLYQKSVKSPEKVSVSDATGGQQITSSKTSQSSEVSRPTIGDTTVSTGEAARI